MPNIERRDPSHKLVIEVPLWVDPLLPGGPDPELLRDTLSSVVRLARLGSGTALCDDVQVSLVPVVRPVVWVITSSTELFMLWVSEHHHAYDRILPVLTSVPVQDYWDNLSPKTSQFVLLGEWWHGAHMKQVIDSVNAMLKSVGEQDLRFSPGSIVTQQTWERRHQPERKTPNE